MTSRRLLGRKPLMDVVHQIGGARARAKELSHAQRLQRLHVLLGDDPATCDQHIVTASVNEELTDAGEEGHMGSAEDRESDDIDILLNGGGRDHLRGLVQSRVDDLHASVAKCCGHHFRATIVAIEARLRYKDADRTRHGGVFEETNGRSPESATVKTSGRWESGAARLPDARTKEP